MFSSFSNVRWVFFDVGYTLFDETPAWEALFGLVSAEMKNRGRDVPVSQIWSIYDDLCENYAPLQWLGVCERLTGNATDAAELAKLSANGWTHAREVAYPGAAAVVHAMHGRYKLGIIANQSAGTVERLAERKLGEYFDLVIGSAEAGVRKPDPAIFRLALQQANCLPHEAVMIGDRIDNDIRPAKALGMKTVHVRQGGSGRQKPRSAEDVADATVDSIAEVAALFQDGR